MPGRIALQHARKDLFAGLNEALGPACLLGFEGSHLNWQLRGALDILQILELPPDELGAIAEVGIFGEGVVLPSACGVDGFAAPHSGGSVEVEEDAGAAASAVFQHKMAVEEDRLDLGEEAVVAIQVGPAGLHHSDGGFREVMDDLHDPLTGRDEVSVEDCDKLAARDLKPFVESSGFVSVAVAAV